MGGKNKSLELVVSQLLTKQNKTIAVAESCSGGLISHRLTNIPGSSKYFKLSIVAYSPAAKISLLKIPEEKIKIFGTVSKEITLLIAKSVRKLAGTTIGLGITGIAGPTGGTKLKSRSFPQARLSEKHRKERDKPVGLVYIAYVSKEKDVCKEFRFTGNRLSIKCQASKAALEIITENV